MNASSNGNIQFTTSSTSLSNVCLPSATMGRMAAAYWDDLLMTTTGDGIYTTTTGTAPNRQFIVEYRAHYYATPTVVANFETIFSEATGQISFVYGTIGNDATSSATIGLQGSATGPRREFSCNTNGTLPSGRRIDYNPSADYANDLQRGQAITPGTDFVAGSNCDDCVSSISLPFSFSVFGTVYTAVAAGANGNLQFNTTSTEYFNSCLPASTMGRMAAPYWDDLYATNGTNGIYT